MKISAVLLFERLSAAAPVRARSKSVKRIMLQGTAFCKAGTYPKAGVANLAGEPSPTLANPDTAVVYYNGAVPASADGTWISLNLNAEDAMNVVSGLFDLFNAWEGSLSNTVLTDGSLKALLAASYKLLENPIFLLNPDFTVRAKVAENTLPPGKQIFNEDLDNFEIITAYRQSKGYTEHNSAQEPYFVSRQVLPFNSLNSNLFRRDSLVGLLMVAEGSREFRDTDAELLSTLSKYAGYLLEHEQSVEQSMDGPSTVLFRMLSDMTMDYDSAVQQLNTYGWRDDEDYLCAYFYTEPGNISVSENERISYRLRETYPGSCAFVFDSAIVCYFNITKTGKTPEQFFSEINLFIRDNYLRTGYSRIVTGKNHLRRQYKQACFAFRFGRLTDPYKWIFRFDDYIQDFLREHILNEFPAELVCHPGLMDLKKSDIENGTEYMITLKTLLDNNMNTSVTARELFIHRSTLLYRLEKIKGIICSSLEDPEELLYISLSFRLMDR